MIRKYLSAKRYNLLAAVRKDDTIRAAELFPIKPVFQNLFYAFPQFLPP